MVTKKALEAVFPFSWEDKALKEIIQRSLSAWGADRQRFEILSKENESIPTPPIPIFESESKELITLYEKIFNKLIFSEPFLYRIFAYISLTPDDTETRQRFFEKYLSRNILENYYKIPNDENILIGSDLAKNYGFSGIPVHACFVGKVLKYLLDEADRQRTADFNIPLSIIFKKIKNGLIIECSNEADYTASLNDELIDEILYKAIVNSQRDRRQHEFFGKDLNNKKYKVIIKFNGEEKEIPFQLLPKYAGLVLNKVKKAPEKDRRELKDKNIQFLLEAVLGEPYNKKQDDDEESNSDEPPLIKPEDIPYAAFYKNQLTWRLSNEWKKESTEALKKMRYEQTRWQHIQTDEKDLEHIFKKQERISRTEMEHSGGSLDDFTDNEDNAERRIDILNDADVPDFESTITNEKILEYAKQDKRLMVILECKASNLPLSSNDQKYYERAIKRIRIYFKL